MSGIPEKSLLAPGRNAVIGDDIPSNPFSTSRIRPGAIPYVYSANDNAVSLVARLRASAWRGQIVGPHGSGKSSLVVALLPAITSAGRKPILVVLHDGERSLAAHYEKLAQARADSLVIIDGFEQLSSWNKWRVKAFCRRRASGLLVTAHTPIGLPMLATTAVDLITAQRVLQSLLPDATASDRAELQKALVAHRGNLRDALFDLYDLHELRRRI